MGRLIYSMSVSLDGFVETPSRSLDWVHVDEELLDGTRVDQAGLHGIGRHVGNWYSHANDLFEIRRPD